MALRVEDLIEKEALKNKNKEYPKSQVQSESHIDPLFVHLHNFGRVSTDHFKISSF